MPGKPRPRMVQIQPENILWHFEWQNLQIIFNLQKLRAYKILKLNNMCGILGYIRNWEALPVLINGCAF